jgi:hypothetical protein
VVQVVPLPEPDDLIVERMAKIADKDISLTMSILDRMVRGDTQDWRARGWMDSAAGILSKALKHGGVVEAKTRSLIDFLGRRGYTGLGKLIESRQ